MIKSVVALVLTFTAGVVDIVGFLGLYHTFTAHMTGVTVHLGDAIESSHWADAAVLGGVLISFIAGALLARICVECACRYRFRGPASAALAIELVLISAVAVLGGPTQLNPLMVLLLAAAMGAQTAALTRVGSLTVHTTFVTGMLNKFAQLLSHAVFLAYDHSRGHTSRSHLRPGIHRQAMFMFSIWGCYIGGALAGTAMQIRWNVRALILPSITVLAIILLDQFDPLAIEEERDQGER